MKGRLGNLKAYLNILPRIDKLLKNNKNLNEAIDNLNKGIMFLIISNDIIENCNESQDVCNSYRLSVGLFNLGQGIELTLKALLRICGRFNDYEHFNKKLNDELLQYFIYDNDDAVKNFQIDLIKSNFKIIEFINNSREFAYSKSRSNRAYTKSGIINIIENLNSETRIYLERIVFLYITLVN